MRNAIAEQYGLDSTSKHEVGSIRETKKYIWIKMLKWKMKFFQNVIIKQKYSRVFFTDEVTINNTWYGTEQYIRVDVFGYKWEDVEFVTEK